MEVLERCNANKKATYQYSSFTEQREQLAERKKEADKRVGSWS